MDGMDDMDGREVGRGSWAGESGRGSWLMDAVFMGWVRFGKGGNARGSGSRVAAGNSGLERETFQGFFRATNCAQGRWLDSIFAGWLAAVQAARENVKLVCLLSQLEFNSNLRVQAVKRGDGKEPGRVAALQLGFCSMRELETCRSSGPGLIWGGGDVV